jgi:hypothetical protein
MDTLEAGAADDPARLDSAEAPAPAVTDPAPAPPPAQTPAPAPAPAEVVPPPATSSEPLYAVLLKPFGDLIAGQVVFGSAAAVAALGDGARAAKPADISVSAPFHYPLEP